VTARVLAGECFYKSRQYADAQRALRDALLLDPENLEAHRWLAGMYFDMGANSAAETHLRKISELAPLDGRPEWFLGRIEVMFSRNDLALAHYQESLRREPNSKNRQDILFELAMVQLKLRRYGECLQTVEQLQPGAGALAIKAECQYGLADPPAALATLEEALSLDAKNLDALSLKGKILLETGQAEAAREVFAGAAEQYPTDYLCRFKLAEAYRRLGQAEKASAEAKQAQRLRQLSKKLNELQLKAAVSPLDAEVRYELGELLSKELNQADEGRNWFEIALGIDPNHERARQALEAHR
jgi:Tfp pilus assembly protein PilF